MLRGSYYNGFAPRDGMPLYPSLWQGCVGAWAPCLGPTGVTLRDWAAYKNNGTLTNMDLVTGWQASAGQWALNVDGVNDYVDLTTNGYNSSLELSVSAWIRADATTGTHTIIGEYDNSGLGNYVFRVNASNQLVMYWNNAIRATSTGTVVDGKWHHVAVVRRGSSGSWSVSFWIDGVDAGTTTGITTNPASGHTTTNIGRLPTAAVHYFQGGIDDLRLYTRPLNPNEITILSRRRGITYDLAPMVMPYSEEQLAAFKAAWALRQRLIIGGGGGLG